MTGITVTELSALSGAALIDVREQDEFDAGHIDGVTHIPLGELERRIGEVPSAPQVYVVCAGGGRSMQGAAFLRSRGLDAVNVNGGTVAWQQAGFPIVRRA